MVHPTDVELDEVEARILHYFEESSKGMSHTQDIADATGITRHTAAKYLSVLEAKSILGHDTVGNAKVWYPRAERVDVRTLRPTDVEAVTAITSEILDLNGTEPREVLTNVTSELRNQLDNGSRYCLGATADDRLVGFVIGDERSWEFGSPVRVGWIRIVGVHPNHQDGGIGRRLCDELLTRFEADDVQRVRTIVGWEEPNLLPFFHALGFDMSESTVLEKSFTTEPQS